MTQRPKFLSASSYWLWFTLWFLAGIDGFKLLEPLRELGARPFFLLYIFLVFWWWLRRDISIWGAGVILLVSVEAISLLGFLSFGVALPQFGDKTPIQQFFAHSVLFLIGFSPLAFKFRSPVDLALVRRAAFGAFCFHAAFVLVDGLAIAAGTDRPFEESFLGSLGRDFPTGLFSEPSYFAAFVAMTLPFLMYRLKLRWIAVLTAAVSLGFFLGDVRSFFMVYAGGMLSLVVARWGFNWRAILGAVALAGVLVLVAANLNLLSVEQNLSSAYRLGNTLSYLDHAISSDQLLGSGFGTAHFLYPRLDFPAFMYLSQEFDDMLGGVGNRVPVFNLWVRMSVEVGLVPVLMVLMELARRVVRSRSDRAIRPVFYGALMFSFSGDSYIYGMFTLALMLLCTARVSKGVETARTRARFKIRSVRFSRLADVV